MNIKTLELKRTELAKNSKAKITHLRNIAHSEELGKAVPAFKRFVLGRFEEAKFPSQCYFLLRNTFGHVAHHSKESFYICRFGIPEVTIGTLERMIRWVPCGYNKFVEEEIIEFLDTSRVIQRLKELLIKEQLTSEEALVKKFASKYGYEKIGQ